MNRSADEAWKPFKKVTPAFADFRDASYGPCTYRCTVINKYFQIFIYKLIKYFKKKILDCLRGLEYAIKLKWFDVRSFNLRDYEYYERVENGDLNVIIPEKFIAFSGPSNTQRDNEGVIILNIIINFLEINK